MPTKKTKIAIVLFNLGGPDNLDAVEPFLFNLFSDRAIIRLPYIFRMLLAYYISKTRSSKTKSIYKEIGNKSPILEETQLQATALEMMLNIQKKNHNKSSNNNEYKTFIIMRYWKPRADEVIKEIELYNPNKVILLPLYPQFSTTTTQSSFDEWQEIAKKTNFCCEEYYITSYYNHPLFIDAQASVLMKHYEHTIKRLHTLQNKKNWKTEKIVVLFSAHGLPKSIIDKGDPYQKQIEASVDMIVKKFKNICKLHKEWPAFDYKISYQSKVGRLEWLGPSTEDEIKAYASEKRVIVVVPIAFVSEHSETLVELDIEYKKIAEDYGCPLYERVSTVRDNADYIKCLADLCLKI